MLDNSGEINVEEIKADCTLTVGKNSRGTEAPLRKPKFTAPAKTHLVFFAVQEAESSGAQSVQAVLLPSSVLLRIFTFANPSFSRDTGMIYFHNTIQAFSE